MMSSGRCCVARLDAHRRAWSAMIDVATLRAEVADALAAVRERG